VSAPFFTHAPIVNGPARSSASLSGNVAYVDPANVESELSSETATQNGFSTPSDDVRPSVQ